METTVVTIGAICLIAAVAGGGLEALGIRIPLIPSPKRQLVLAGVGLLLILAPHLPSVPGEERLSDCGKFVSADNTENVNVAFKNYTQRSIDLYWLSYEGTPKLFSTLRPRGSYPVSTFIGHSWCLVDKTSGKSIQTITIMPGVTDIPIH